MTLGDPNQIPYSPSKEATKEFLSLKKWVPPKMNFCILTLSGPLFLILLNFVSFVLVGKSASTGKQVGQ